MYLWCCLAAKDNKLITLYNLFQAYLAFRGFRTVSTGRWGCGIFRGLPAHKFAQQLVAAKLAGCTLEFST